MLDILKKAIPNNLKKRVKLFLHKGNKYHCPICNYDSKDLYTRGLDIPIIREREVVGSGLRNAGCYKCDSTDRERLIYTFLKEEMKIFHENLEKNILHIAPEKNLLKIFIQSGFKNYQSGDLFTEGYEYPDFVKNMNILNLPFDENTFDLIICNHVLEHVPNDLDAMKELYRVLKKGGKGILQVPISINTFETFEDFSITDPQKREMMFGQFDHVRIYGQDYSDRLSSVGFKVNPINISKEFGRYGLDEREDIYVVMK